MPQNGQRGEPKPGPQSASPEKAKKGTSKNKGSEEPEPEFRLGRVLILAGVGTAVVFLIIVALGEGFDAVLGALREHRMHLVTLAIGLVVGGGVGLLALRLRFVDRIFSNSEITSSGPYRHLEQQLRQAQDSRTAADAEHLQELERRGVPGLEAKVRDLDGLLRAAERDRDEARGQVSQANQARDEATRLKEEAERKLDTAEQRADSRVKGQIQQLTRQRDELRAANEELTAAAGRDQQQLTALRNELDGFGDAIAMLQQLLNDAERQHRAARRRRDEQQQSLVEDLQRQRDGALSRQREAQQAAAEAGEQVIALKGELDQLRPSLRALALQLAEAQRLIAFERDCRRSDAALHVADERRWMSDRFALEDRIDALVAAASQRRTVASDRAWEIIELEQELERRAAEQYAAGLAEGKRSAPPPDELEALRGRCAEQELALRRTDEQIRAAVLATRLQSIALSAPINVPRPVREVIIACDRYRFDGNGGSKVMTSRQLTDLRIRLKPDAPWDRNADWEARMKLTAARSTLDFFSLVAVMCELIRMGEEGEIAIGHLDMLRESVVTELRTLLTLFDEIGRALSQQRPDWLALRDSFFHTGLLDNVGVGFALASVPDQVSDAVTALWCPSAEYA